MANADPFRLQRFIDAQQGTYSQARTELAAGRKRSHWMWFMFPQIHGLASSPTAQLYALSGLPEASAYLAHPLLSSRLRECTELVNAVAGQTPREIFGYPDDLKFHSSMTLFALAANASERHPFQQALTRYFRGLHDTATIAKLG